MTMQMTQPLHSAADTRPDHLATIDGERRQSWSALRTRVARLASGLRALGVQPGDRVAILALNSDHYTESLYAVWWAGGAVVPMNSRWAVDEHAYSLDDSGAAIIIVDAHFTPMAAQICKAATGVRHVISIAETGGGTMLGYEAIIADHQPCDDARRGGEDLAGLFYTGGTTGFPKGVMLPHRALWYNHLVMAMSMHFDHQSIYLHAAPMFHLADLTCGGAIAMVGGTQTYLAAFDPAATLDIVAATQVSHLVLVPTMLGMMLSHPELDLAKLGSVRHFGYGASPMPEGLLRQAMASLPGIAFTQAYGQTEMAPFVTMLAACDHILDGPGALRTRSAGLPAPGCEVKIVDADGQPVPRGAVGEVAARSPGTMLGYWNQPDQTAATLVDGWVHTGDGAWQDDDGYIYIVDRMKDMIVSGGENVFSAEVESAISTHPDVAAVCVIGIPDPQWGEAVHAIIIPHGEAEPSAETIIAHCRARIAGYKCPRSISLRREPFPLSGAGKVLKRELREPYWDGQNRNVG